MRVPLEIGVRMFHISSRILHLTLVRTNCKHREDVFNCLDDRGSLQSKNQTIDCLDTGCSRTKIEHQEEI